MRKETARIEELLKLSRRRKLDGVLIGNAANIRAMTGVNCDNAVLTLEAFYTDFRYIPMVHRVAPELRVRDLKRLQIPKGRIGYESTVTQAKFQEWQKSARRTKFVDIAADLAKLRTVKTPEEIAALKAAEALNCAIWREASASFRPGMTELDMARRIRHLMIDRGEGEAFDTIVCIGKNAAECHHEPDRTVWNGREPVLVDMGVKLGGVCSDLTRNLVPPRQSLAYRKAYALVEEANRTAIAAVKPGMTARKLDKIARDVIRKGGFGKCFGHSLGHGVGFEIHEEPFVSKRGKLTLEPGMVFTIEPGIYLEDNFGIRIEDMVLVTENGCEVLSKVDVMKPHTVDAASSPRLGMEPHGMPS